MEEVTSWVEGNSIVLPVLDYVAALCKEVGYLSPTVCVETDPLMIFEVGDDCR
jgi:hypothetical protein